MHSLILCKKYTTFLHCKFITLLKTPFIPVYWSCQFIARVSNVSLKHWQQMGGVNINEDIIIDKSIHRSINSRSSVLKVEDFCLFVIYGLCYHNDACGIIRENLKLVL